MHQPPQNSVPSQSRKSTGKNKQFDVASCNISINNVVDKKKQQPPNKVAYKRPPRVNPRQCVGGQREKSFSKNERKFDSRNYNQPQDMQSEGPRAIDVQDLLNFQYASHRHTEVGVVSQRSRAVSWQKRNQFFNKEEFLQAKCQFVVIGEANDYMIHSTDPDLLVDWNKVHLVYIPSHDPPTCPICLYPPVCAKITKCGHIFCWSCMLHYLQLSEKTWHKCPICHEAVHQKDLKSVKPYIQKRYAKLDSISMTLMKCVKGFSLAYPKCPGEQPKIQFTQWLSNSNKMQTKIMLATPEDIVRELLLKEKDELKAQLNVDLADENGEAEFVEMAIDILEEEINSFNIDLKALLHPASESANKIDVEEVDGLSLTFQDECFLRDNVASSPTDIIFGAEGLGETDDNRKDNCNWRRISENSDTSNDGYVSEIGHSPHSNIHKHNDSHYFYQAEDTQNIFLHSLNARCLIEEYGSLDFGPSTIKGQIIDFECFTMTKELRKRFRYLSHLPLCSEFMICELILKPPLLSKRTIHNFMPEFKHRKSLRLKKFKEQQKFDIQAKALDYKMYGFPIDSVFEEEVEIDLTDKEEFPSNLSPDTNDSLLGTSYEECKEEMGGTPSFAQILNAKKNISGVVKQASNVEGIYRSQWASLPVQKPMVPTNVDVEDDEPDVVAPDFKDTFSAAMFAAPIQESTPGSKKGKGNKKRKEKGTLLFATGGQRKY